MAIAITTVPKFAFANEEAVERSGESRFEQSVSSEKSVVLGGKNKIRNELEYAIGIASRLKHVATKAQLLVDRERVELLPIVEEARQEQLRISDVFERNAVSAENIARDVEVIVARASKALDVAQKNFSVVCDRQRMCHCDSDEKKVVTASAIQRLSDFVGNNRVFYDLVSGFHVNFYDDEETKAIIRQMDFLGVEAVCAKHSLDCEYKKLEQVRILNDNVVDEINHLQQVRRDLENNLFECEREQVKARLVYAEALRVFDALANKDVNMYTPGLDESVDEAYFVYKDAEKKVSEVESALEDRKVVLSILSSSLADARESSTEAIVASEKSAQAVVDAQSVYDEYILQLEQKLSDYRLVSRIVDRASKDLAVAEKDFCDKQSVYKELKHKYDVVSQDVSSLISKYNEAKDRYDSAVLKMSDSDTAVDKANSAYDAVVEPYEAVKDECSVVDEQIREIQLDIDELEEEIRGIQQDYDNSRVEVERLNTLINSMRVDVAALESDASASKQAADEAYDCYLISRADSTSSLEQSSSFYDAYVSKYDASKAASEAVDKVKSNLVNLLCERKPHLDACDAAQLLLSEKNTIKLEKESEKQQFESNKMILQERMQSLHELLQSSIEDKMVADAIVEVDKSAVEDAEAAMSSIEVLLGEKNSVFDTVKHERDVARVSFEEAIANKLQAEQNKVDADKAFEIVCKSVDEIKSLIASSKQRVELANEEAVNAAGIAAFKAETCESVSSSLQEAYDEYSDTKTVLEEAISKRDDAKHVFGKSLVDAQDEAEAALDSATEVLTSVDLDVADVRDNISVIDSKLEQACNYFENDLQSDLVQSETSVLEAEVISDKAEQAFDDLYTFITNDARKVSEDASSSFDIATRLESCVDETMLKNETVVNLTGEMFDSVNSFSEVVHEEANRIRKLADFVSDNIESEDFVSDAIASGVEIDDSEKDILDGLSEKNQAAHKAIDRLDSITLDAQDTLKRAVTAEDNVVTLKSLYESTPYSLGVDTYIKGISVELSGWSDGSFTNVLSLSIDDKPLSIMMYKLLKDSGKIVVSSVYANRLSVGLHTMKLEFGDGVVETKFVVKDSLV